MLQSSLYSKNITAPDERVISLLSLAQICSMGYVCWRICAYVKAFKV